MTTDKNNQQNQDDEVLGQLFKAGAKEQPPTKLDDKILNYAANANKPDKGTSHANNRETKQVNNKVSSHFGGGWKVPLSMAASVVVVFALLVQLEKSPQQLELPPIPEISIPTESKDKLFKEKSSPADRHSKDTIADDASAMKQETIGIGATSDSPIDLKQKQSSNILITPSSTNTVEQKQAPLHDQLIYEESIENSNRNDEFRSEGENDQETSTSSSTNNFEPESIKSPASTTKKSHAAKKQMQKSDQDAVTGSTKSAPSEVMQQRSTFDESATQSDNTAGSVSEKASEMAPDISSDITPESEQEFAPIPIENWLLMIEQLIARKDYAEAARQLEKFKQAHPEVNVKDLETKLP